MKKELIDYLPPVLKGALEFNLICETEQSAVDQLLLDADMVLDDQFYDTASLGAVERYESILSIVPRDTDTLDDRRFRIKTFFNAQPVYTMTALIDKLKSICGDDGYTLNLNAGSYTLEIRVALISKNRLFDVQSILKQMVPANIIYTADLLYNTHRMLSVKTHQQLSAMTHEQMRSEVL